MAKVKKCIVLNAPATPEEQAEYDRRFSRALAVALHRSLDECEYDLLILKLKQSLGKI